MSLEKIAELTDRIGPLSSKSRGMRIEAEEWNLLVETLRGILEIDRAQERGAAASLEENFARRDHRHQGQVGLDWLDPDLQERLAAEGGSLSTRDQVSRLTKKVDSLASEVARLTSIVENQQRTVDRAAVAELDRSRQLRNLENRFSGVEDLRTSVTVMGGQVAGLSRNVDAVLELRSGLLDDQGNLVSLSAVQRQLTDLQGLRTQLTGVDGTPIRLRDFEVRVRDIEDAVGVGGGGLDNRFAGLATDLEGRLTTRVDDRVRVARGELEQESTARSTRLRGELEAKITSETERIDAAADARVGAAEERLNASLGERVATATATAGQQILADSARLVDQRIAGLDGTIADSVGAARAQIEEALGASLGGRLDSQVRTRVEELAGGLRQEIGQLSNRLTAVNDGLPAQVRNAVATEAEALSDRLSLEIDGKVSAARTSLGNEIGPRVTTAVGAAVTDLDGRIDRRVSERLTGVDGRIEATIDSKLAQLPDEIGREVKQQLQQQDFPGQIATAVDRAGAAMRADLAQTTATLRAERSTAINNTVTTLRAEVALARRAAIDEAFEKTSVLVDERTKALEVKLTTRPLGGGGVLGPGGGGVLGPGGGVIGPG